MVKAAKNQNGDKNLSQMLKLLLNALLLKVR